MLQIERLQNQEDIDTFLINGAIGDFLLFDSLLNNKIRKRIKKIIIWNPFHPLNPKGKLIEKMIRNNIDYNSKTEIKIISYQKLNFGVNPETNINFSQDQVWINSTIKSIVDREKINLDKTFIQHRMYQESTKNYASLNEFKKIVNDSKNRSGYIEKTVATTFSKYDFIKEKYCVIVPYTSVERTFKPWDISQTIKILTETLKMPGVVLTGHKIKIRHENIIDLSQKTTICESIEITKRASFYIGIDSFLSIIAAECLSENNIIIKVEKFGINHPYFYNKIKCVKKIIYPHVSADRFIDNMKKNLKLH